MPDSPESFRLPEAFASAGDPVNGNPFPANDRRHTVWKDATRIAEEETGMRTKRLAVVDGGS